MRALIKLLFGLLLGVTLGVAAAQRPSLTSSAGNTPTVIAAEKVELPAELAKLLNVSRLRLTDGRTLRSVKVVGVDADAIMLNTSDGTVMVPYALFPADLQPKLAPFRPVKEVKAIIKGDGVVEYQAQATPTNPNAPLAPLKRLYPGRIRVEVAGGKLAPLANAIVMAVRPTEFAAYSEHQLALQKPGMDAALAAARTAVAASFKDPAARPAATAARADWQLTVYASFDPLPKAVATTSTDANGAFTLVCEEDAVVIIARGTLPVGDKFAYYIWVLDAEATGNKVELDSTNLLAKDTMLLTLPADAAPSPRP